MGEKLGFKVKRFDVMQLKIQIQIPCSPSTATVFGNKRKSITPVFKVYGIESFDRNFAGEIGMRIGRRAGGIPASKNFSVHGGFSFSR